MSWPEAARPAGTIEGAPAPAPGVAPCAVPEEFAPQGSGAVLRPLAPEPHASSFGSTDTLQSARTADPTPTLERHSGSRSSDSRVSPVGSGSRPVAKIVPGHTGFGSSGVAPGLSEEVPETLIALGVALEQATRRRSRRSC